MSDGSHCSGTRAGSPRGEDSPPPDLIESSVVLARALQERSATLQTAPERRQQAELDRLLQNPADKETLVQLTDQAFRSRAASRTADHLTHILDVQGVPRFFSPLDRALLRGFQTFGGWLPGVAVPLVKEHMRHETANVVLPAEPELLARHLEARNAEGLRMNVNLLGEAILGEAEAARRMEQCRAVLRLPEVEVLSVKISTLYSQISPLARQHTLDVLADRLRHLFSEAASLRFTRADGRQVPKFIYLDMEEYRDLYLTAAAFRQALDGDGLRHVSAGLALQAYIPDSARVQQELNAWARERAAAGGAPITIRLVKGANLEMERVEAVLRDWPQAPFPTKRETDANYKRMLQAAFLPENLAAVRVGVASHNLFDLAYALLLARHADAGDRVQFEMLEGMANAQRRALSEQAANVLLYGPACPREEFLNAIGYLIRRLDENTGPENFLRHAFHLHAGSAEWQALESQFRDALRIEVSDAPRRTQNRLNERFDAPAPERSWREFRNEPDTDWSLPPNSSWAAQRVIRPDAPEIRIPLVIAGEDLITDRTVECRDPSRPDAVLARCAQADEAAVDRAVAAAQEDRGGWRSRSVDDRSLVLGKVAQELRRARGALLRVALANGGKTLAEADPEISEAVDFVEFYRASAREFFELSTVQASGRGVVGVIPPWNFPIAIPAGGVAAALASGNTVVLKPASDTALIAWELCQCFWRAGVPRTALQFLPGPGSGAGQRLATHPEVSAVILTGGTDTARHLLRTRPDLRLAAETGGKNATIVTALSDRELAIKQVVHSAFSHSGQKCSATSLLLLEGEVYDDEGFKRQLVDAAQSLRVGSAWDLATRVGPLIRPPAGPLHRALTHLDPGETWALQPVNVGGHPNWWSPGIKYGVQAGSPTHRTEFFGPVLGVMRFERLDEAIALVNATAYGLTSGLHSLDDREQREWRRGIRAGNLYLNRGTVGAVVLRQPFGGWNRSSFGPGMKAGGPHYVAQFMQFSEAPNPEADGAADVDPLLQPLADALRSASPGLAPPECARILRALASYTHWWRREFAGEHDHFRLLGQDNLRRYEPFRIVRVRVAEADSGFELFARAAAARITGARVVVSVPPGVIAPALDLLERLTESWAGRIEFLEESDGELAAALRASSAHGDERIRFAGADRVPASLRQAAAAADVWLGDEPVLAEGRVELLWYVREQSVSYDYHRYGNLGTRANESRRLPE